MEGVKGKDKCLSCDGKIAQHSTLQRDRCQKDFSLKHRLASELWEKNDVFDPFQVFQVCDTKCNTLKVHVLNGKKITQGAVQDFLDTPDPYVILSVPKTPNRLKRTRTVDNCINPTWDNIFYFYINPDMHNDLSVKLMDANDVLMDSMIGEVMISLDDVKLNVPMNLTIIYKKGSRVNMRILKTENDRPHLRFSLALSKEEKEFLRKRRKHALKGMKKLLGEEDCPKTEREVPCVAALGSGGGIRALIGYSAASKALQELNIFDCIMFMASLSGSSWFLSYLYSQPEFPAKGPKEFQAELREILNMSGFQLLNPLVLKKGIAAMVKKSVAGQPISFTDLFGHLLGHLFLKNKEDAKLSDQQKLLKNGDAPLPLYTAINVKKDVSARVFQEWVEFSPFEIGVAKYGTYTKPENFGSKFFLGNIIRKFDEPPLHFLQGIWGSAYSIQFKRLVRECCKKDNINMDDDQQHDDDESDEDYIPKVDETPELYGVNNYSGSSDSEVESHDSDESDSEDLPVTQRTLEFIRLERQSEERDRKLMSQVTERGRRYNPWRNRKTDRRRCKQYAQKSAWQSIVDSMLTNKITNSRALRAGIVYNAMRGLQVHNTFPLPNVDPTVASDEMDFKGQYEPAQMGTKKLFLVDSGLTFNLPFPLLLRPQRAVDLYLCFDFSLRGKDEDSPFEELIIAERWARLNQVPFPPIKEEVKKYLKEDSLRECYVFEDVTDLHCPVVLFFPLVNNEFRHYKAPGIKRETKEEVDFASFSLFNDPKKPFDTFKFHYSHEEFDRLAGLVEFNIRHSEQVIKKYMKIAMQRKRDLLPRPLISPNLFAHLKPKSEDLMHKFKCYMKTMALMQARMHLQKDKNYIYETDE
ncbi:cytosolic phospholipase A2-like [Periplaneta americana]|uniref:cytosolic phospholipase A2-like n=1 Tax=Periplaneta americana TaxID=6978 RepID=UPI0037E9482F